MDPISAALLIFMFGGNCIWWIVNRRQAKRNLELLKRVHTLLAAPTEEE